MDQSYLFIDLLGALHRGRYSEGGWAVWEECVFLGRRFYEHTLVCVRTHINRNAVPEHFMGVAR